MSPETGVTTGFHNASHRNEREDRVKEFARTLAMSHLVFAGVLERYPGIQWTLTHMGGRAAVPGGAARSRYEASADCRQHIAERPSEYLKRCYFDTVNRSVRTPT